MSLMELMVALGIMVIMFGGAYLSYASILDTFTNTQVRTAAVSLLNRELETIRTIPYSSVGVIGGYPAGVLERQKVDRIGSLEFLVETTVRNIDDPYDGTLGGTPNDTAPADYKFVEVDATCLRCARAMPVSLTTTVAPKNLEATGQSGSLFVNVLDASGQPLSGMPVHVVNTTVTPTIDLTDTTNRNGVLQLVGFPTSTQSYQVSVSSTGYSTDRTYPPGAPGNPNPVKPHATVAVGQVTNLTFQIDRLSTVPISASTRTCLPQTGVSATFTGSKLIGTSPNVVKVVTSTAVGAGGTSTMMGLEWDTYTVTSTFSGNVLVGTIPTLPLVVNPNTTVPLRFVLASSSPRALAFHVADAVSGAPLAAASVRLTSPSYDAVTLTGRDELVDTDWSGGTYTDHSSKVDVGGLPGSLRLLISSSSTYPTSTEWLTSRTFDFGSTSTTLFTLSWTPLTQPSGATVRFQIASNNDDASWLFVGPDGTSGTYYTESGTSLGTTHQNRRYVRYQASLATTNPSVTPRVDEVRLSYTGPCVPPDTTFVDGLVGGTYTYTASASGYLTATGTIAVGANWQELSVVLGTP